MNPNSIKKLDEVLGYLSSDLGDYKVDENKYYYNYLCKLGYAEKDKNFNNYTITAKGMNVYLNGGLTYYFQNRENITIELETSIKLNKWYYKHKWLPYSLSILSVAISIIALFIKSCSV